MLLSKTFPFFTDIKYNPVVWLIAVFHKVSDVHVTLLKQTRLKKEFYLITQDNTIYTFSIKFYFSSIEQDNSKLQKQISKILILTEMAA